MKKLRFALLIPMLFMFTSCYTLYSSTYGDMPADDGVWIETQYTTYGRDTEQIQTVLHNDTGAELEFGSEWYLETEKNGVWMRIPFRENVCFNSLAYMLMDGGTHVFTVSTSVLNYDFPAGEYRIVKQIGEAVYAGRFTIGDSPIGKDSPYGYADLSDLPDHYSAPKAAADGVIFPDALTEENVLQIEKFFTDFGYGMNTQLRFAEETPDGKLILTDILAEKKLGTWRITYRVDAGRTGGDSTVEFYSSLNTSEEGMFSLGNVQLWEKEQTEIVPLNECAWNGREVTAAESIGYGNDFAEYTNKKGSYWSADGRKLVSLLSEDVLTFTVSELYENGGEMGYMAELTGVPDITSIRTAVWQDEDIIMFECGTDKENVLGHVLFNTADNGIENYSFYSFDS